MNADGYLYIGVLCYLLGAVSFLLPFRNIRSYLYIFSTAGALAFAVFGLFTSWGLPVQIPSFPISSLFAFVFRGDALSGFFMIIISVLAFAVSIFSVGYARELRNNGLLGFLFNLFILTMYAVVLSGNIITFLISWEAMSVVSYFLVSFDRDEESAKAGLLYAVMTHIGTAFIIALFLILYSCTGQMDFWGIKSASAQIPDSAKAIVFVFSTIGFGMKAGIVPLHTWLPRAHPAAPSNISALMSGVMIKTGIYGFIRICMDLMGPVPEWWGITIIVIGAVSSILGVLYALMEHDLKRLLAYHSVENIGIILLGIGASLLFKSHGLSSLSAIALIAALYHTLNHAIFKGLLFLCTGSLVHATHTRNMEEMGGIMKSMPYTGLFFLIGSVSICGLPPFNGFVSEWLTYQSLLLGFQSPSITSKIVSPLGGAALALTSALAAACFVKAFGISFLGMCRGHHTREIKESPFSMTAGMGSLAILCLVFGIAPGVALKTIVPVAFHLTGSQGMISGNGFLHIHETMATLSPAALSLSMVVMALATALFVLMVGRKRKTVYRDSWDCGIAALTPRMQYTATAFTKPIRLIFKRIYLPKREITISYILKPFFVRSLRYSSEITPFFENYLYGPFIFVIKRVAAEVRLLQSGSLHLYLGYILITLILLLIFGT